MDRRTKRILFAAGGAVGVGAAAAIAIGAAKKASVSATSPATGTLSILAVSALAGNVGGPLTGTITVQDAGQGQIAATSLQLAITLSVTSGNGKSTEQMAAVVSLPAIAPGSVVSTSFQTQAKILPAFGGGTTQVVIQAMSQTITGTLQIAAVPASFKFAVASVGTIQATVGEQVRIQIPVTNQGGTAAVPVITGTNSLGQTIEGHWQQVTNPTIQPGQTANVEVETSGTVSSEFAGQTETISLTVTP